MLMLDIQAIQSMIRSVGLQTFYVDLIKQLETDFSHWHNFRKTPRHATHYDFGVIELMPCADEQFYSFKYVNGHPDNTKDGKLCVAALGLLAEVKSGYPLMICEMTILTALRTAAVAALAAACLARPDTKILAIIGCGAQSEFQAMAMLTVLPIKELRIYDTDAAAMQKFIVNLQQHFPSIIQCTSTVEAIQQADMIITATAAKKAACLFTEKDIQPGTHIHAMGGDCPGKTELDINLLKHSKLIVEFSEQSLLEGEIQQLDSSYIHAELWQLITQQKAARENTTEITIFDSVGFALEDFSTLKHVYQLAHKLQLGTEINLIPDIANPKDLFGLIS